MCHLPEELLEIYTNFMQGHFVVKQRNGLFDAVAVDMKLEQIIEQSHKSTDGIMGQTRQSEYNTKWENIDHEIHSISNAFREINNTNFGSRENKIHHELEKRFCSTFNFDVKTIAEFILKKRKSLQHARADLYNFVSGITVPSTDTS